MTTLRTALMPRLTRRAALAGLAATAIGAPALIRMGKAADPIRIGVLSPVTGAWTVYGQSAFAGL
jgi:urea transport system substrate-binding protein